MNTKKDAKRKKALGELGELFAIKALVDEGFTNIKNLNDEKMNFPYGDLYAENGENKYIISVKARNKFEKNGKENTRYKLGQNPEKAYKNAKKAEKEKNAKAYWMVIPFDTNTFDVYMGSLDELDGNGAVLIRSCQSGKIGECLQKEKPHYFDWDYFANK